VLAIAPRGDRGGGRAPHPTPEQERASGLSNLFKRYGFIVL